MSRKEIWVPSDEVTMGGDPRHAVTVSANYVRVPIRPSSSWAAPHTFVTGEVVTMTNSNSWRGPKGDPAADVERVFREQL